MPSGNYEKSKDSLYRYYNKRKRDKIEGIVKDLSASYGIEIDVAKILEMYDAIKVRSKRMYIVINCLVYLYLRHFKPLAVWMSDMKITSQDLLAEIRSQLIEKHVIVIDYENEVPWYISMYLDDHFPSKREEILADCKELHEKLKNKKKIRSYTSRVISAAIVLVTLGTKYKDLDYVVSEIFDFFKSTDVSVYAYKKIIDSVLYPSVPLE